MPWSFYSRTFGNNLTGAGGSPPSTGDVHYDCLVGVRAEIQALGLTGLTNASPLPADRVYLKKLPTDEGLTLPCVLVSLGTEAETANPGTNAAEEYGYPCLVTIVVASDRNLAVDAVELRWRETIRTRFQRKRPDAVVAAVSVSVLYTTWEPRPVLDPGLFQQANLFVSSMLVRVFTREAR